MLSKVSTLVGLCGLICITLCSCRTIEPQFTPISHTVLVPDGADYTHSEFYTGMDDTAYLQGLIDYSSHSLVITKEEGPWIVDPLYINRSDLSIYLEEGAQILAKEGSYMDGGDSLISAENQSNIQLIGLGDDCRLTMRRSDYDRAPYKKAEWRHAIDFRSVDNVIIQSLIIEESGGDGIYIGMSTQEGAKEYSENILISGCQINRNYRQGISIISVKNLIIEDCEILNTKGTAPRAGIDFEPNRAYQFLENCLVRDCVIQGNRGPGILIWFIKMDETSPPCDIRIENCDVTRNPLGINIGAMGKDPTGTIILENLRYPMINRIPMRASVRVEERIE